MPQVERSIAIDVTPAAVFDFVADYRNALKWMHNFTRFEPESPDAYGLGARVTVTGTAMGIPMTTTMEINGFDRPVRLSSRTTGKIATESSWNFAPEGSGTRATFIGKYDLPGGLIRLVGGNLLQRELETNAEKSLLNLKTQLESSGT